MKDEEVIRVLSEMLIGNSMEARMLRDRAEQCPLKLSSYDFHAIEAEKRVEALQRAMLVFEMRMKEKK